MSAGFNISSTELFETNACYFAKYFADLKVITSIQQMANKKEPNTGFV